jgi:hypothetical protein
MVTWLIGRLGACWAGIGQRRSLAGLDNRTLNDLGVNRSAVAAACAGHGVSFRLRAFD